MPARKLNADDVEDLRIGWEELMQNKSITRVSGDDGHHPIVITTTAQLAAWKHISPARFHELKREGWKLKQGSVKQPTVLGMVSEDSYNTLFVMAGRRIKELEAEVEELRKQLKAVTAHKV